MAAGKLLVGMRNSISFQFAAEIAIHLNKIIQPATVENNYRQIPVFSVQLLDKRKHIIFPSDPASRRTECFYYRWFHFVPGRAFVFLRKQRPMKRAAGRCRKSKKVGPLKRKF